MLITGAFPCSGQEIDRLEKLGYSVRILVDETIPMASQGLEPSWVEGIICNSFFLHNQIEDLDHLRWIQLTSAGYDRVPVDYIREHHIKLLNAKDVYSIPMAEFALCGVLELYKKSRFFAENQVNQTWKNIEAYWSYLVERFALSDAGTLDGNARNDSARSDAVS